MSDLLIFGLGYSAQRIAVRLKARGWRVTGTSRSGDNGTLRFEATDDVLAAIARATHILSSVPPGDAGSDPVLLRYGAALRDRGLWLGYLSSTGVYGDVAGAWVDEQSPLAGRRGERVAADQAWLALGARVFRLPGIYGPGRSALDRVAGGRGHRIDLPGQVFSRVHVDDIARGVIAGFAGPPGAYNLGDDAPCSQNDVIDFACRLLGQSPPPLMTMDEAGLSPMARGFYAENRRVANGKARRLLGWQPRYRDYRAGLRALRAITSPSIVSAAPAAASNDQR
ncbi:MAG: NAD(P)-dependent oxidoreductase [Sphingomonas sp. 28-62-20]|uniref:NAD(P)-dependent oxidoreductase n=1 Tax=Sphingomonas sp. 28-62-20 TaxID=1970433 RepID=UPI000BC6907D|nr:MAG: NAD(P)-dependent oxidoreductase [Sphingomonas sp. 28-62-20]